MNTTFAKQRENWETERQEIRQKIDLVQLAEHYGTYVNRQGQGQCPFHQDDTPSFHIYPDNHFHCFGCDAHGDVIRFIELKGDVDFKTALEEAKSYAGMPGKQITTADLNWQKKAKEKKSDPLNWQAADWQVFAENQVKAAQQRMVGTIAQRFEKDRGLTLETARRFEVGWTGDKAIRQKVGERFLFIPAQAWVFPVRDETGKIKMLKWRNTVRPEGTPKKTPKYGQLGGGEHAIYNLARAKEQNEIVLCTGEFEVMVLWQEAHIEASCHSAGENSHIEVDDIFGTDKPVVYVADNDTPGIQAASEKQHRCDRLRVCYLPKPHKDLTDKLLATGFQQGEIASLLQSAKARGIAGRRHKTAIVELPDVPEITELETVDLATAREMMGHEADQISNHKNKARSLILQVAAAPGTGKGHAFNYRATENAKCKGQATAWFGQRHDQYNDQERDPDWWKQIKGRSAARDTDGNPVDFNDPSALPGSGNCTVDGSALAAKLGEKGWEKEFHKYCQFNCPAYKDCQKAGGYHEQKKRDGRNAYMTFEQMFTTLAKDYSYIVIDEPSYRNFVDIVHINSLELKHMRRFVINAGMQFEMKALLELIRAMESTISLFEECGADAPIRTNGVALLKAIDQASRSVNNGAGLLELIDRAEEADRVYGEDLWELLAERSLEAAEKLPLNFWHIKNAEPGAGGLYDLIKEEARTCLMSGDGSLPLWENSSFVSRIEIERAKETRIKLYRRHYLPPMIAAKPIVALDATGNPELLKKLLSWYENTARVVGEDGKSHPDTKNPIWEKVSRPVKQVAPKIEMPGCVKVYQDTRRNFSKTSLIQSIERDPEKRYWNLYLEQITGWLDKWKVAGKRALIVACAEIEKYLVKDLEQFGYTKANGYEFSLAHYGNLRGSNEYKNYDCVMEAGMYMPEPQSIIGAARALHGGDGCDLNTEMTRIQRVHNYKNKDGKGLADEILAFKDERLQQLLEVDREDEHVQALHRIRPLEATTENEKEIVLLFSLPLAGVKVNEIISEKGHDLNSVKTVKFMESIVNGMLDLIGVNPYFTIAQLIEKLGESKKKSVYKYLEKAAEMADISLHSIPCWQSLKNKNGGVSRFRRDLIVGVKSLKNEAGEHDVRSSRKIIYILIILGELRTLLPKGWEIASEEELREAGYLSEEGKDLSPELPETVISSPDEAPLQVRAEVAARLHYLKNTLSQGFKAAIATNGNIYNTKAATVRELYLDYMGDLNRITKHTPKGVA